MLMSFVSQVPEGVDDNRFVASAEHIWLTSRAVVNTVFVWMRMFQTSEWQAKLVVKVQAGFEVAEPEPMEFPDSLNAIKKRPW